MITKGTSEVLLIMQRYNPQLGNYCTIKKCQVKRILRNTVTILDGRSERKFDLEGYEKTPTTSLYGSSSYYIFTQEEALKKFDGERFDGVRISYGKELLQF